MSISIKSSFYRYLIAMQKVKGKGLNICSKCGNVMVTRVVKRGVNPKRKELEKILQCIVCKHWEDID